MSAANLTIANLQQINSFQPPQSQIPVSSEKPLRIDAFAQAAQVPESDYYIEIQKAATSVFNNNYTNELSRYPTDMSQIAATWEKTQGFDIRGELDSRIEVLLDWLDKKEEATKKLQEISKAYNHAIESCAPPKMDPQTIVHLRRMKIKTDEIENQYIKLFHTQRNQIIEQKKETDSLIKKIDEVYHRMKRAIEPDAYRLTASIFGSISYGVSWGGTPYVDSLRDQRLIERSQKKQNLEESKEADKP